MGTKRSKIQWTVALGAAGAWFGQHCGAGFASGLQEIAFFVNAGWLSLLTSLVPMVVIGLSFYFVGEFARKIHARSYKDVVLAFFPNNVLFGRALLALFDLAVLSSVIVTSSTTIAGAGTLLNQTLGIDYLLATVLFSVVIVIVSMFGARILAKLSLPLSVALVGSLLVIAVALVTANAGNLGAIVAERRTFGAGTGEALWNMVQYTCFQTGFTCAYIAIAGTYTSRADSKVMAISGIVVNTGMLALVSAAVLSGMPGVMGEDIPILALVQQHFGADSPLFGFYSLSLFLAYVSTADVVAATSRFGVLFNPTGGRNQVVIDAILGIALLGCSLLLAQLGIQALVNTGYKMLGSFRGPVYLAAGLVFSPIALRRLKRESRKARQANTRVDAIGTDAVTTLGIAVSERKANDVAEVARLTDTGRLRAGRLTSTATGPAAPARELDHDPTPKAPSKAP